MANRIGYSQTAPVSGHGWYRDEKCLGGSVAIVTADLATGNTVALVRVPKGFTITGLRADLPAMDSNGTPTLALTIGDAGTAARLVASSTTGRAGGQITGLVAGAMGFRYTADTDILMTFATGSATAVAGTIVIYLFGFIDN
jgi:hypothetical protein